MNLANFLSARHRCVAAGPLRMNWAKFVMWLTRANIRSAARELRETIDSELGQRGR